MRSLMFWKSTAAVQNFLYFLNYIFFWKTRHGYQVFLFFLKCHETGSILNFKCPDKEATEMSKAVMVITLFCPARWSNCFLHYHPSLPCTTCLCPGIISKLDHFLYLGVETLWLSPFCTSPQADFGYDVADYKDVDPIFGTMEDFRELVKQCKLKGYASNTASICYCHCE